MTKHAAPARADGQSALRIVDSIAELRPEDRGSLVVCGSHGGASAARYALAARPALVVFNDAGVGRENAGIVALDQLQQHGIAAATVSHLSARIGDAASTLDDGIISHVNKLAARAGITPDMACRESLTLFRRQQ